MRVIGLVGKKRSGKDTAADWMTRDWDCATKVAFADPVKNALMAILGCQSVDAMEAEFGKEDPIPFLGGVSLRRMYQTLGTEWGRRLIHPHLWIKLMDRRLAQLEKEGFELVVVSDVRFENEANYLRNRGARMVHIIRPNPTELKPWWTRWRTHFSEKGVKPERWETVIHNDSTLEAFRRKLSRHLLDVVCES